jgi:hypothetical protein
LTWTTSLRVGGILLGLLTACSLIVDTSDVAEGCPEDQWACFGRCVDPADAPAGCRPNGCVCQDFQNAIFECVQGQRGDPECVVVACLEGYGCPESNCAHNLLIDEKNCGECGNECAGETQCVVGTCQ